MAVLNRRPGSPRSTREDRTGHGVRVADYLQERLRSLAPGRVLNVRGRGLLLSSGLAGKFATEAVPGSGACSSEPSRKRAEHGPFHAALDRK